MKGTLLILFLFLGFLKIHPACAQQTSVFKGQILNEQGKLVQFASIYIEELDYTTSSSMKGEFSISYPASQNHLSIRISSVGKITFQERIELSRKTAIHVFKLKDITLTLSEVTINPLFGTTTKSNSSIVFDEEAIERIQAFSLMDILNTIPGRATVAPNINAPQTITLRGNLGGNYDLNNSLGVPIIIDGVVQSNDANMQSRSVSQFGMAGSILSGANASNASDVPFQGMDLRDIPVETIERVEVIQGVASAEYGEMTDGAIIVDRKAGAGPYQFTTSINGGSSNYSIGKGFKLPQKWGAINLGLNYAISNPDPRDKVKQYARKAASLIWSKNFGSKIKNSFSFDYNRRDDDMKQDPDDGDQQMSFSRSSGVKVSNRFNYRMNTALVKQLNLTASYSESNQHTYKQWLLNTVPKGYTFKDTTGIYEGVIIGGRYISEEEILGNPITASASLRLSTFFSWSDITHAITYGGNYSYSNNGGKGVIANPELPRWIDNGGQNARPYNFGQNDAMQNIGIYLMDNFSFDVFGKRVSTNVGLRYDLQNNVGSLQPRVSSMMKFNKKWSLDLAYGISTKSPTLAHRYPAPTWLDIPLILAMNSSDALYLVYTQKYLADNSHLKASRASQLELGIRYSSGFINSRVNVYYKSNRDGFRALEVFRPFTLPVFEYHYDEITKQMVYNATGETKTFRGYSDNHIENVLNSNTFGADWIISTKTLKTINTSISASTSFILGSKNNKYLETTYLSSPVVVEGENIWHLLFNPLDNDSKFNLTSKFSTTTHVPKLGFVISTMLDLYWTRKTLRDYPQDLEYAVGYIDGQSREVMFEPGTQPAGASRSRSSNAISSTDQHIVYGNFNLNVAKEIKKNLRISIAAYNVFNIQPEVRVEDHTTGSVNFVKYNSPVSITGSITIKF